MNGHTTNRKLLLSGYHFCFLDWRSRIRFLIRRPPILTGGFRDFPQSLRKKCCDSI